MLLRNTLEWWNQVSSLITPQVIQEGKGLQGISKNQLGAQLSIKSEKKSSSSTLERRSLTTDKAVLIFALYRDGSKVQGGAVHTGVDKKHQREDWEKENIYKDVVRLINIITSEAKHLFHCKWLQILSPQITGSTNNNYFINSASIIWSGKKA